MSEWRAAEYYHAVKIRESPIARCKDLERHIMTNKRESANYAALDYAHRIKTIGNGGGDIYGVAIERGKSESPTTAPGGFWEYRSRQTHRIIYSKEKRNESKHAHM